MRTGVVFPTCEIGNDPKFIVDYAQTAEDLGFNQLIAFDHVVGAGTGTRPDWQGPYTHRHPFHEPFVLFGFMAGVTKSIELVSGVIILPQRQTALVAKQAAAVDVLSGGRLRLGVGSGWNPVEYEALGQNFHTRGKRQEEQVKLMRELWTNELVTFEGEWDTIRDAGINPLPVQRPIPVWFGGNADALLRRAAQIGDGWFPLFGPGEKGAKRLELFRTYVQDAGRGPGDVGVEAMLQLSGRKVDELVKDIEWWREHGATHVSINTMNADITSAKDHIETIVRFAEVVGLKKAA